MCAQCGDSDELPVMERIKYQNAGDLLADGYRHNVDLLRAENAKLKEQLNQQERQMNELRETLRRTIHGC